MTLKTSTVSVVCFVNRRCLFVLMAIVVLPALIGCGGATAGGETDLHQLSEGISEGNSANVLPVLAAKRALQSLPYSYTFRHVARPKGAHGALAGRVVGNHNTVLNFGIALGRHPEPVPVPHAGAEIGEYPGFLFTDDELVPGKREKWEAGPQFHTAAQWKEVARMSVAMVEQLCRASTHQPCPVGG
jgi:hypothetical protein